ncbi:NAD(P)H-flavin reductase [Thalassotalea loyana]|uniref:NAD(P)H-flavin reductase n=1 Tax=Thalassotalea loyana TaxID=280483 RepID=A0ABQ6HDW1_9GAMM|nr:NAD(P)H-flavin reductase [Thalassotalea loyana]GLX86159.1 NAD(P)H-flavin reductase [Thalassotalea loyana]
MKTITCQVEQLSPLTEHVYKVLLKPEQAVSFEAGQYLNFVMSEDDKRPFSIASAPESDLIELQIGAFGADSYPMQVIDRIKSSDTVQIEVPAGKAQFRADSERPILLLAGGTGFSYIKSIFEHLVNVNCQRPVIVYWGLREPSACYELEKTAQTIAKLAHASFIPVVENPDADWQGKVGLVHEVAMKDIVSFEPYDIYLAGRFDMVGKVRQDFIEQGGIKEHMFADAFAFI